jgi:hypothetical protein
MKLTKVFAATLLLGLASQAARAQVPGMPFYPTPTGTGILVSADYAHPGSSQNIYAVRGGLGFASLGFTAVVGSYKLSGVSAQTLYGASAAMKLFGGGTLPISLAAQAGVGQLKVTTPLGSSTGTYIPVGAAARVNLPLFPLKPFAVGYYNVSSDFEKEFRFTLGADWNFPMGLGVHAAYDVGKDNNAWGVGAHFNFRLPSM